MIIFEKNDLRISLITPALLRTEKGSFTDLPTQTVLNRDFCEAKFTISQKDKAVIIKTDEAEFTVNSMNGNVMSVILSDGRTVTDFTKGRLPGTARTLDQVNGKTKLEPGITSRLGASVMDDSKSLLLNPDGSVLVRPACSDRYWFAYGNDYLRQLSDFFRLTGEVPLIPKYALGNWWSRYRAYTQEEYRDLMKKFISREIPITVATIDMDWHWTDVVSRFGWDAKPPKAASPEQIIFNMAMPGWTGYSWNTELFPDYRELLGWLHGRGFKVTLNVHPSQGVRFFEDQYTDMCRALGRDPKTQEPVAFDPADPDFMRAYFDIIHHPYEDEGVDFWWIDWQQGKTSKIPGLDPLWALNHYHTVDSARGGKRPLILSRYAGLGSHRYPLGFSGDTVVTWKSLDFQPYFTNCAANAGYTWWSHDIGGHMHGVQDDELYLRWLQYGVFSPINRLHSSNSDFMGKEPWKKCYAVQMVAENFLRLRHKLIPYLYTANYRTYKHGEPICMPMYYRYNCNEAYEAKNQYIFGGQLIVSPITRPADKRLNLSYSDVWLPEGRWTDIFNGRVYQGGRWVRMFRDIDSIPALAPEGAIIPMYRNDRTNDLSLDQPLEIHIYRGNNTYELYEDDGESTDFEKGKFAITTIRIEDDGRNLRLTVTPQKEQNILPERREIFLKFRDIDLEEKHIILGYEPIVLEINDYIPLENPSIVEQRSEILTRVQGNNDEKNLYSAKMIHSFISEVLAEMDAYWHK